nr:MAG TPA: hypothetical protein [Caudoviricetes sp.]
MHKSHVVLNKVCVSLVSCVILTIPAYASIVMLLSSNSRSTIVRLICKLAHYIIVRSITIAISVQLLSYKRAHSVNESINRIILTSFIFMQYRMFFVQWSIKR